MFPQHRQMHEEIDAFNKITVKETCVIKFVKVVWIGTTIVTHFARFSRVHSNCVGQLTQHFESSVGRSEVADRCHHRVPDKVIDSSSP